MGVHFDSTHLSRFQVREVDGFIYYYMNSDGRTFKKLGEDSYICIDYHEFLLAFESALEEGTLDFPSEVITDIELLVERELANYSYYRLAPSGKDIEVKKYKFLYHLMQNYPYLSAIRIIYLMDRLDKAFIDSLKAKPIKY